MNPGAESRSRLLHEGVEALRQGKGRLARDRLEAACEGDDAHAPWLLLAQACRMIGDDAGEETALARLLDRERRNLPALLMMADLKARRGDDRSASSFYKAALGIAAQTENKSPALMPMLQRGQAFLRDAQRRFADHLEDRMRASGLADGRSGARVRQSLDLMFGRSELYLQQPTHFYFPGLPQRQFYERDEFDWLPAIEATIPTMREELEALIAAEAEFAPYIQAEPNRPVGQHPLLNDPSWGALHFWKSGRLVEENAVRCPRTVAALEGAPIPVIRNRSPIAHYSLLKPGTHLKPHNGMLNTRLICHIPLILPGNCAIRVGSETRAWREGEALIFDDSIEHEAWNRSASTRVILLFEIWRPELSTEERLALTTIFEAIDLYGAGAA